MAVVNNTVSNATASLVLVFIAASALLMTVAAAATPPFSRIFAFGDSFTDTGNTQSVSGNTPYAFGYVSNPPYGTTYFRRPTNRYSDGRLVIDFLASTLGLPFVPPYVTSRGTPSALTQGANFAVAGSTALAYDFFRRNNLSIDIQPDTLSTQQSWFDDHLSTAYGCGKGTRCPDALDDALVWVGEIGVNDYAYSVGTPVPPEQIRQMAVANVGNFLQSVLDRGARYVVLQGLPLIGCLPLSLYVETMTGTSDRDDVGCWGYANRHTQAHNDLLQQTIAGLRDRYPNAIIAYADYAAAHHAVIADPAGHGFTEPYRTCCGIGGGALNFDVSATCGSPMVTRACTDPDKYVNWDGVHLTEHMYGAVADMFFRQQGFLRPPFQEMLRSRTG